MQSLQPPPFVTVGEWTKVSLRGGRPGAKITDISVAPARSSPPEADETNIEEDVHRNERAINNALRAHVYNRAHHPQLVSLYSGQESRCQLKQWKPKVPVFDEKGHCEFQVMLEGTGGPFEVCAKDEAKNNVFSLPFGLCMRRLTVTSSTDDWEAQLEGSEWPKSWLKDMGKKDKTLSFTVSVEPGLPATIKVLQLRAILVYSDGLLVPNQRLLSIKNHALELSEKRNSCTVNFRIEDVSKNHQSKAFVVIIEPLLPMSSSTTASQVDLISIAPACAFPVVVKSKINKKRKSRAHDDGEEGGVAGSNKLRKVEESPAIPPELLTTLSVALSESLIKNSKQRAEAEDHLNQLVDQMRHLQGEMCSAMDNLTSLSKERAKLESQFSELIGKCSMVDKPAEGVSHATPLPFSDVSRGNALSMSRSLSKGPEGRDLVLGGASTASVLFLGGPDESLISNAMLMPSGLVRLGTGDLLNLALNVDRNHSLASSFTKPTLAELGDEDDDEADDDEEEEANDGAPLMEFIRTEPVTMASGEKRWMGYSSNHKLVGFFLEDGSFVDIGTVRDTKWKERQEQLALSEPNLLKKLDGGNGQASTLDEVLKIVQG